MKVMSVHLSNFGSYKNLDLYLANSGLTLIQGPTGSGKSTLCDIIPWILYGITAKGGKVDEIRSWGAKEQTFGSLLLDDGDSVCRSRDPNDLVFSGSGFVRGSDLRDTQRRLDSALGLSDKTYLAGAYFHEFSETAQFFQTTAKNRRQICEELVDLSLSKDLAETLSSLIKDSEKIADGYESEIALLLSNVDTINRFKEQERTKATRWKRQQEANIEFAQNAYDQFEANRKKVITNVCKACKTVLAAPREFTDMSMNPYEEKLKSLRVEVNPYVDTISDYTREIQELESKMLQNVDAKSKILNHINDLEILQEVNVRFRSTLINQTILFVKDSTNALLTRFFDGEIQVEFAIENDKIDIAIQKDGNDCSFTQLSKGQRQLLKLCFGVSVMKAVQNFSGVKIEQLWFDEVLTGLDEELKIKAFSLLEELSTSYDSVFVVEHSSSFKALFSNVITVELKNGHSEIQAS